MKRLLVVTGMRWWLVVGVLVIGLSGVAWACKDTPHMLVKMITGSQERVDYMGTYPSHGQCMAMAAESTVSLYVLATSAPNVSHVNQPRFDESRTRIVTKGVPDTATYSCMPAKP
jgi:hypothetical protein